MNDDIADLVSESLIVRDLTGHITLWNRASEKLYGWRRADALGRDLNDLLVTRHLFPIADIEAKVLQTGAWEGEVGRHAADGTERKIELRWTLRRDEAGNPHDIVETGRDITALSALEQDARLAAHRYRNLFQAMAAGFWEMDFSRVRMMIGDLMAAGVSDFPRHMAENPGWIVEAMRAVRVIDVNDKAVSLFGATSREEIVGGHVAWCFPPPSRRVFAESLIAAARRQDRYATETTLTRLDGSPVDVLFTVCWPEEHKGRGHVLVGVIDITERKQAEEETRRSERRYRELFDNMPVALGQLDLRYMNSQLRALVGDGRPLPRSEADIDLDFIRDILRNTQTIEVNPQAVRLFRANEREEMLIPIERFWRTRPETVRRTVLARLRGEPGYSEETQVDALDGTPIDVLYTVAFPAATWERGTNIVAFVDIGDRVAALAKVEQMQTELAHAGRVAMLGELAASIAHEVNQPLAAISASGSACLRWLARPEPDLAEVRELAGRVVSDAQRAAGIIARVRDMAANRRADHVPVSLNDVVEEATRFLKHEFQARQVELHFDPAPGPALVAADRIQVQQVIVNLAVNAMQAMAEAATPEQRLSITVAPTDADRLCVIVEDNGPGLTPSVIPRLFDSFFTTKRDGLGIGLAVCRSIIEAHGGGIEAENRADGPGARFCFTLPALVEGDVLKKGG
ncbi:PAS domain-containing sensor histidine kinase [Niveispirillum sp. KHB5.9]|uniref:PAS domain-containing sensor histidine kinase n=1 Tax=Niveispirillum sp. KHB5.9 TaxID=3400269 RepID=UPI003A87C55C